MLVSFHFSALHVQVPAYHIAVLDASEEQCGSHVLFHNK